MTAAKIMVVEDEGLLGLALEEKLNTLGYTVVAVVRSGEAAIAQVGIVQPDLLLMDVHLGSGIDGITAAANIQSAYDVPIIYLTAHADDATLARAQETTPFGYLLKPFAECELRASIEMALYKHRLDTQLKTREQWLTTTLRSIGDAVVTTDDQGVVTFMNPVAETLTGWTHGEAVGHASSQVVCLLDGVTRTGLPHPLSEALRQGQSLNLPPDSLLIARDGTERPVGDNAAPIRDGRGQTLGAVLVFRDMTVARNIEQERLKAQKLESLGILAGGIAHDFNNALMRILGHLSLAKAETPPMSPPYEHLLRAEQGVTQATRLSRQLLTFAKGDTPVKTHVSTAPFLRDIVAFALQGGNIQSVLHVSDDLWALDADCSQIDQVLSNLVINAQQAMPAGGTLTVSATNVTIPPDTPLPLQPGQYVQMRVHDQGVGIPAAQLVQIFDPYFTTKPTGSGLGLAVAHSIIKQHGGHIAVTSSVGVGTTFDVYLPAAETAPLASSALPAVVPGQGRILVMDDDETLRVLAEAMLGHLGYAVETCADGVAALEQYRQALAMGQPFTAVVLDLTIRGGMGGQETFAKLRELDPQVRGIVASGYSNDPHIMAQCQAQGFRGIIAKPYELSAMSQVLLQVLQDA